MMQKSLYRFELLSEMYLQDYELNNRNSIERAMISVNHLKKYFGGLDVGEINTDRIRGYIKFRCSQRTHLGRAPAPATINRELAALKRMLRLAARETPPKISVLPYVPMFREENIRTGFFEWNEVQNLLKILPFYLKGVVLCAFFTGMRRGEILSLSWNNVDLEMGVIRLDPSMTKTKKSRIIYMPDKLKKEIMTLKLARDRDHPNCNWVFARDGKRIKNIQRAWKSACRKAGLPGKHFHDFRRSGVRNLIRAGVPERVAMMISGHKTRSIFDRYFIVNEKDLRIAAESLDDNLFKGDFPKNCIETSANHL